MNISPLLRLLPSRMEICFCSIEAGKFADIVILDTDILKSPVDDIKETKVLATLLGGEAVHGSLKSLTETSPASLQ